jgi:hypothetical protein
MDRGKFTREFKLDCAADQGSRRLMCAGVARFEFAIAQLGEGVCEDPRHAFSWPGGS